MNTIKLKKNALFNPEGDTDLRHRRMIGGNTTNSNDFNNMRYKWVSDWYRQAMNNFWIPEEINLTQDTKDYPHLDQAERTAYDKILSFLVFLDSLQSNNLPTISEYITANEVNLCLHIQAFQECILSNKKEETERLYSTTNPSGLPSLSSSVRDTVTTKNKALPICKPCVLHSPNTWNVPRFMPRELS